MSDDKRLIAAFTKGREAARGERPRCVCHLQPSSIQYDAWQAGYDYEEAQDNLVYTVAGSA